MLGEISSPSMTTVPVVLYNTPPLPVAVLPAFCSGTLGVPPEPAVAAVYVPNLPADMVVLPPLFINTPPFEPALFPVNVAPLALDLSAPAKNATPPFFVAELLVNELPPDMVIAPPKPVAQNAPPLFVAELLVNDPPLMVSVLEPPEKVTAPPLPVVATVEPVLVPAVFKL